jgi:hypothetical protein
MTQKQLPLAFKVPRDGMEVHDLGNMDVVCPGCGAKFFKGENPAGAHGPYRRCCLFGAIKPQPFTRFPALLKNLLTGWHVASNNFRRLIRQYNNSLAFGSVLTNRVRIAGSPWPYCYKISGQFFRTIHAAFPDNAKDRCFGHYWIFDPNEATDKRMKSPFAVKLDRDLLFRLAQMELKCNSIAKAFRQVYQVTEEIQADNPNYPHVIAN